MDQNEAGYICELETISALNRHHIKGVFRHPETGRSFLFTDKKVATPKLSTKFVFEPF
jgi:hypothetical protein